MTAILIYLLLNKPFTVLHYAEGETTTVALYSTAEIDSVRAGKKDAALPIWINYTYNK